MVICYYCLKDLGTTDKRIKLHKECKIEVTKFQKSEYYENNKEKIAKKMKLWRSKNKDKLKEYSKKNHLRKKEERKNWFKDRKELKDLPKNKEIRILNKMSKALLSSD